MVISWLSVFRGKGTPTVSPVAVVPVGADWQKIEGMSRMCKQSMGDF